MTLYELGILYLFSGSHHGATIHNRARLLLGDLFQWLGVTGYYLPGLMVVAVLLAWHIVRKDPWRIDGLLLVGMFGEALALAMPLVAFTKVLAIEGVTASATSTAASTMTGVFTSGTASGAISGVTSTATGGSAWQAALVFSFGAGVYEELLFRLVAIAALHLFLVDYLALPEHIGEWAAVTLPILAFAWYHFDARANPFSFGKCFFYLVAGGYFTAVYLLRGFGVAAGCHALFDVMVVLLNWEQGT